MKLYYNGEKWTFFISKASGMYQLSNKAKKITQIAGTVSSTRKLCNYQGRLLSDICLKPASAVAMTNGYVNAYKKKKV
jgi:hypothetical protein